MTTLSSAPHTISQFSFMNTKPSVIPDPLLPRLLL